MTFPRYPDYKDSGVEWLGDLPNSWRINKIKFSTYVKGRVGWHGLNSNEFNDVGVHLVTGTDFENGFVSWDRCYRISEERYLEDPYIQLRENDLLITKDGTIGKLARVKGLPGRASLNSGVFLVRAKEGAYSEDFLYWVLQSSLFGHFMDLHKAGSTIQHLYQEVFNQFAFPIPLRSEQNLICVFLDRETAKIDALIAEQQRLIELLKEKRQAVISHAVTKGLNPDAPMKDSGIEWLGKVPEYWEVAAIKRMTLLITDGAHISPETEGGVYDFVSTKDIGDFGIDFDGCLKTSPASYDYLLRTGCQPVIGDILFSKDGTIGRTVVVREQRKFVVASSLIIIRPDSMVLNPTYLSYLCQSFVVIRQVEGFVKGAGLPRLSVQNLLKVVGVFPPLSEQVTLTAFLDRETAKIDDLTIEAQTAITLLQERRTALISAAVTGKIDVRSTLANQGSQPCP